MSITTMGDQTQAYDIFQTPLSSGYPLPLNLGLIWGLELLNLETNLEKPQIF